MKTPPDEDGKPILDMAAPAMSLER